MVFNEKQLRRLDKLEMIGSLAYSVEDSDVSVRKCGEVGSKSGLLKEKILKIKCNSDIGILNLSNIDEVEELHIKFDDYTEGVELYLPKKVAHLSMIANKVTFNKLEGLSGVETMQGEVYDCTFDCNVVFDDIWIEEAVFTWCKFKGGVVMCKVGERVYRRFLSGQISFEEMESDSWKCSPFRRCLYEKGVYLKGGDNWIYDTGSLFIEREEPDIFIDWLVNGWLPMLTGTNVAIVGNSLGILQLGEDSCYCKEYPLKTHTTLYEPLNLNFVSGIKKLVFCGNSYARGCYTNGKIRERIINMHDLETVEIRVDNFQGRVRFPHFIRACFTDCELLKNLIFVYVGDVGKLGSFEEFARLVQYKHVNEGRYGNELGIMYAVFEDLQKDVKEINIEIEFNGDRKVMDREYVKKFFEPYEGFSFPKSQLLNRDTLEEDVLIEY